MEGYYERARNYEKEKSKYYNCRFIFYSSIIIALCLFCIKFWSYILLIKNLWT